MPINASVIWQAWDDEALYYITEVSDNVRDTEGGERAWAWWSATVCPSTST